MTDNVKSQVEAGQSSPQSNCVVNPIAQQSIIIVSDNVKSQVEAGQSSKEMVFGANTNQIIVGFEANTGQMNVNSEDIEVNSPPKYSSRALFQSSPTTPSTPVYKKYRSVKGRIATPKKVLITPMKKRLFSKLSKSQQLKRKFQQRAKRLAKRKLKITDTDVINYMKNRLPSAVVDFFSMQLNHVDCQKNLGRKKKDA